MNIRFGWKPDLPDHRDYLYAARPEMQTAAVLPTQVDLREKMSPIEDQGDLGSCVAHASVGALEFLELQELARKTAGTETFSDLFEDLSRMFVYANARILDGDLDQDSGTQLRSAVKALRRWGICRETLWPYQDDLVYTHPSIAAYQEGDQHLVPTGYRIDNRNLNALKQCLAMGFPFIFGMSVYNSFMSHQTASTGIVTLPSRNESLEGGHALCCVGYDDSIQAFIVRNSWGTTWGVAGYCYIPYSYLTNTGLASDFWTLRN